MVACQKMRPVWFVFGGEGTQWPAMGKSLMTLPLFKKSIDKCHKVLETKNVNLIDILTKEYPKSSKNNTDIWIGITAIQVRISLFVELPRAVNCKVTSRRFQR